MRATFSGTQTGPFNMVRLSLPASGKSVKMEQIHIVRVADGRIVEHWMANDLLAFMRQLGLQVTQA